MMYSPRSVSTGFTPAASRASLRSISSVAMDLLYGHAHASVAAESQDDVARLVARGRPVHVATQPLDVVGKALEMLVEALERGFLDGPRAVAECLAGGIAREGLLPEPDELRGGDGERFLEMRVAESGVRALGKGRAELRLAHAISPGSSTCARCSARTREPRRVSPHRRRPGTWRPCSPRWRASCRGRPSRPRAAARRKTRRSRSTHRTRAARPARSPARPGAACADVSTLRARAGGGRSRGRSPAPGRATPPSSPPGPRRGTARARASCARAPPPVS